MRRISLPENLRRALKTYRLKKKSIGFVPTMGDFHEGHLSLTRRARRENDCVVVSIFVNPKQFGIGEDYRRYPRNIARDGNFACSEKVDILFTPSVKQMYPDDFQTTVDVGCLSFPLCGKDRPGHFRGVATVVARLFGLVNPDRAYFGLKDYQQAMVIRQMVRDLSLPIELRLCPLVRDKDGLALSSRNRYLSSEDRRRALTIPQALRLGEKLIQSGVRNSSRVKSRMQSMLKKMVDRIHYIAIVDPRTLEDVKLIRGRVLLAVAVRISKTRLIDNVLVHCL